MSLDYPTFEEMRDHPERRWGCWTPRLIKVLATAKEIATPSGLIESEHLLLAFESVALETGENIGSKALARLGIQPSVALGRLAPKSCPPNCYVAPSDFGPSIRPLFPELVAEEATAIGNDYVGTEHMLLFLARVGVPGVELSYERVRGAILELQREELTSP